MLPIILGSLAAILTAGLAYQAFGRYRDRRRFPPPGRLISIDHRRLHLREQGSGSPVVILEAGIGGSSLGWALVQPEIAEFTRVCGYDRAGLGWSDAVTPPASVPRMIADLDALLSHIGSPPYVLVGHSFGGLLARAYAHDKPEAVAGLVLLDPVSLAFWANCSEREKQRLNVGARLSRRGAVLARIGVVRLALSALLSGGRIFPKMMARASAGKARTTLDRIVGEIQKLPRGVWPYIASHWSNPKCLLAMAAYLECLPASAEAALSMPVPSSVPVTILSAANATRAELDERDGWARASDRGRHVRLEHSGHWVQLEAPEVVVEAVRQLVDSARLE